MLSEQLLYYIAPKGISGYDKSTSTPSFMICAYERFADGFWEEKVLYSSVEIWVAQKAQRYLYYAVASIVMCSSKYTKLKNSELIFFFR